MLHRRRSSAIQKAARLGALTGAGFGVLLGACGGRVIIDQGDQGGPGGVGGSSSSTSSSDGGNTSVTVTASAGSVTASTGTEPPPPCVRCGEFISNGMQGSLCPDSEMLYSALKTCSCATKCIAQCADNACTGGPAAGDCTGCIQKQCKNEFNQCANDV